MYPGTREESLQYSISLTASPHSRWQMEQQTIPVTSLTTPVSGSTEVALGPGNYSVTVTVTNQHGSIMSAPQAVTVPGQFYTRCWSCCIMYIGTTQCVSILWLILSFACLFQRAFHHINYICSVCVLSSKH